MSDVPPGRWTITETPPIGFSDPYLRRKRVKEALPESASAGAKKARSRPPVAIEICCGSATLSHALKDAGFAVKPIDWKGNRHRPHVLFLRIDLCSAEGQKKLWQLLRDEQVRYVHCAPLLRDLQQGQEHPHP